MNPLVSVVMPNYNNAQYVKEAIESIINQSYKNWELIIIDDCSTDNSMYILQQYIKEPKIKVFQNRINVKIARTRNNGLREVDIKSKYIAVMDSDDISECNRLLNQVQFLEDNPEYGAVGGHTTIINEDSEIVSFRKYETNPEKIHKNLIKKSQLAHPATLIRKSALEKVGFYNETLNLCEDYDLWFRIAENYKIGNLNQSVLMYRISKTQTKHTKLKETLYYTLKIQKKYLFKKEFFSISGLIYHILEHLMYLMPARAVWFLFKNLNYKGVKNGVYKKVS